ncbi:neuroblast differentiation-associated protein AHNAK-like [Cebidichthys violaceus]|uniref:neuroblast differentiation-associated protein AHNAK-like n=1 Tax=Cebidichthys violaceus TaxID=271503 RepID=UPI0035C9D514
MFEKRSTSKMSKLKEDHSPESGVIVKTAQDGCSEGLVYGGGGREGIFIKEVVPESPASKSLKLKEGDQILSATVYFDNVSYEDAIQILEHAQGYKMKLCLKRNPGITETESALESDVIPEEDVYVPEMREQGKTKRRGEARISWPKFPSFGKGRKSRFTRSHSSSEADEQRKLELSPTTSDTESPIKSQDALKGKKKHKIKLSGLTKRGRISSSEDQDTDAPTSAQMLSPECLESPSGETPQVYVTEDLKVVEDLRRDQELTEPQTVQHKVELITIASTLKTEDLTVALAGQESPSGIKSPDGKKKKKKELSQLKIKILGKDKSHKKDAKAKSSPKRLKTMGASIETADQPENEKSDVIPSFESRTKLQGDQLALDANTQIIERSVPKVELEISDVALLQKSPQKGEEKTKKGKDIKQKQEAKKDPTFKLPKVGFSDIASEETIPKMNVNFEERTTKIEQLTTEGTEVKEDPFELLSKSNLSRTKLPKREDIEIPGMEDMSKRTTAKRIKEPKTVFTGHYEDIQAETVQMSIDVDSVKEAVSKLPGFKLPKVDTSGMPIPEEITVIDANAQRISVKTPTKTRHEAHFSKFEATASPEIYKTTIKLPKITPADLASEELLMVTQVDLKKPVREYKAEPKQSDEEVYKREHIIIPGKESSQEVAVLQTQGTQDNEGIKSDYISGATSKTKRAKITMPSFGIAKPDIKIPDIGIHLPKQNISEQNVDNIKGERTIFLQEVEITKTETRNKIGGVTSDVKIPEIDGIEYIDSVDGSPVKKDGGFRLTGFGVNLNADSPKADIFCTDVGGEVKIVEAKEQTFKLSKFGEGTPNISVNVPDANKDINIDGAEIKTLDRGGKGGKFHIPNLGMSMPKVKGPQIDLSLSKQEVDVTLPEAEVKLPEAPDSDVTLGTIDVSNLEQKMEVEKPEFKVKPLRTEGELDGQGGKFKMPEFGVKMPNVSVEVCDMDKDVKIDGANIDRPAVNIEAPSVDIEGPSADMKAIGTDHEGKGSKFKMPHLGFSMPKVKGPQLNLSSSKKDVDVTLPETSAEIKLPKVPKMDASLGKAEVLIPEAKVEIQKPDLAMKPLQSDVEIDGQGRKFKMPKLGMSMPKVKGPEIHFGLSKKDGDVTLPEVKAEVKVPDAPKVDVSLGKAEVSPPKGNMEVKKPDLEIKPLQSEVEIDGQGSKFKMPKLGMSMPKVKGPEINFGLSKKDGDVTLPEAKAEVKVPVPELKEPSAKVEMKAPEIKVEAKGTEGSPLKFKMPTFKLPKFGVGTPNISVEVPDMDKDVKIEGADINIPDEGSAVYIAAPSIDIEGPSMDMKSTGAEQDGKGSKYKMPHLGFSMPKVKGPKMYSSLPKKDIDVKLPEAKVDVKLPEIDLGKVDVSIPEAKMEVKKPEMEMQVVQTEDELKEKFQMAKFGIKMPKVKGPEFDLSLSKKDVEVKHPEAPKIDVSLGKAEVLIPEANMEVQNPEMEIKPLQTGSELEGHSGKFQMPKFGITMPKVKGPEIDLSFSKKDVDVTLPGAKAEVELPGAPKIAVDMKPPECEAEIDGQGGKFKVPKFGISMPKVKGPEIDLSISKKDVDVTLPKAKAEVELPEAPKIAVDMKPPECEAEIDGQGSKFKMPKFGISMPKVKGPEFDFSSSKKDVDISLPEANAEVNLPKVEIKESSAKVEIEAPEIEAQSSSMKGSPSKFKMPTFKFPKFGAATPNVSTEVPDIDKEITIDGTDMHISVPHTDVDQPEVKAEVHLPDVHVKKPSAGVVIEQQPGVEVDAKLKKPRFSLPRFSFSKPSVKAPEVDASLQEVNAAIPEGKGEVELPEAEVEGSKFKMPTFGISMPKVTGPEIDFSLSKKDVDVTLPEAKAEMKLPNVEVKEPEVEITAPEIKIGTKGTEGSPSKYKMPIFKLPKFGIGSPSATIEVSDKDVKIDGPDIKIPEESLSVDIAAPSIDIKSPSIDIKTTGTEHEGKGSKFKLPSLGFSGPQIKRPDIDLSLSKKDVDVTLPEAKADVKLPDVELKETSAEVKIKAPEIKIGTKGTEGSPSKYKMPTFKLPKFGIGSPSATIEVSDKDVKIDGPDIKIPEEGLSVDIAAPSIDIKSPSIDIKTTGTEHEGKGSKFKLPSLGFSGPQIKRPDIDLSLSKKDVDVTLPEAKADVKLPDVELKETSAEVKIKAPEIKIGTKGTEGSPSKYKMPTFKLPKFGIGSPSATIEVSDKDVKIDGPDITIPEESLSVDIAAPSIDIKSPSIDIKTTGTEHEGKGSKFKLPSLGFSGPQIKRPDIDLSLSKKDVDVTLPEAKAEVKLPDVKLKESSAEVEIKAPEIKIATKGKEGSPSKFKMPTFKLPKFGVGTPSATIEVPDKDVTMDGGDIQIPEEVLAVEIAAPSIDIKDPSFEHEGKGSKFKLPSLSFSGPQIKRPDIDLSLSKKDIDVTLPEAKADVKLPDVELKETSAEVKIKAPEIKIGTKGTEGSPSKYKMPTFKLPKFGIGSPSATIEVPDTDGDVKIDGPDIKIPEEGLSVDIAAPSIDIKTPSIDIKTTGTEHEGKGSKFKLPSLGFSGPQIKRPDIDLSSSKKDVDVTLPEAKAEVKLPDVKVKESSAEVEIKAPEIKIATKGKEGSPSKFKMPTFKLPKFGVGTPSATIEVPDKDVTKDGGDIQIPEEVLAVEIAAPSIDIKDPSFEHEGKGSKFKLPSLSFSGPQIKQPDIDLSLSKKDIDVTLPEAKADVKLPDVELKETSAEVKIKAPEIKIGTKGTEGSPSKYKMPTFKLPRFGIGSPSATIKVPDMDGDVKIDGPDIKIPEEGLSVDIAAPSIDIKTPSIDIKTTGTEHEGKGSKFKLPSLGFSGPQIKRPDIDLSLSKKDVDVTLPEAKAEVKLPDVKVKESSAEVEIKAPEIKIATKGKEGSPSKFKMPTFKLPKFGVGTPSATIEVPDKDVTMDGGDIQIPEEVLVVEIAAPSIDIKDPSIDIKTTGTEQEGKESKFKFPSFSFSGPQIKRPDIDLSLSKKDVDVTLPETKAEVKLPDVKLKESSAQVEIKAPGIDVQTSNVEGSPAKLKMPTFKLPKFGAATPKVSVEVPDVDKDIKIEGSGVDVTAPSIDTEGLSVDMKAKESELEVSGSKFKMPKFGISMPKVKGPEIDFSLSKKDVDVTLPEAKAEVKLPIVEVKEPEAIISASDAPTVEVETKMKQPNWTFPKFSFSRTGGKAPDVDVKLETPKVDVTLPEAKAEVQLPDVKIKQPSATVDIKAPEIEAQTSNVEGSPSKLKMPTFTFPKFGAATPKVSVEVPDVNKDIKIKGATVDVTAPSIDTEGLSVDMKAKESELEVSGSKFKMPKFGISMPKVEGPEIDFSLSKKDVDVTLPEAKAEVKLPIVEVKEPEAIISASDAPTVEVETKMKQPNWTFPKFSFSRTGGKAPDVDVKLETPKVDVTLPEAKAEVQLPDVKIKQSSATVDIKAPEIEAQTGNVERSPSKIKMPTFTIRKFGAATPKVSVEVPDVDKDIKIEGATVDVIAPSIDTEGLSVDMKAKESELEVSGSKFKMPKFGISMPKVKGPEIDFSLSKKDVDVTLPEAKAEVKLPIVEVKEHEAVISASDAPTVEVETKMKQPNWTFPKFSFSRTGGKAPDVDVKLETPEVDVTPTEAKEEVQGPSGVILIEEPPAAEPDANLKKTKFSLPRFSFSKSSVKEPEVSAELPRVDVSLPEGQVIVKQPEMQIKAPELEAELDGQGSKFKFPKFGIALPKAKGPGEDLDASQEDAGITLPEVKADVKLPQIEVKVPSASVEVKASETEAKSKDVGGSPLKFKMSTLKMPKFGAATYDVTVEAPDADKVAETDGAKLKKDVTVNIKGPSFDVKSDVSQAAIIDSETPKTDTDAVGLGSPSKFQLPSFKTPKLSFSRPNPEDEHVPVDTECKADKQEMKVEPKEESKSPKVTFTSFGEILRNIDVEFDVPKTSENLETSKEVHETEEPSGEQLQAREKETKQDATKSPERTGWFKFPKFGLSSPSEPAKIPERDERKDEKSPAGETVDEEISPTCSVQSSDAFADISSAMTSEHGGLSLSSPTKVTVKYSDPSAAAGLGELHSNIITSTTKTELISVEPNLPEKITLLSSGVSSSSEDTLRLESGKIHVITSNIQATPEAQHAKLLTAVQIQSAGGLPRGSEANEAASWTIEDSQSGRTTVFEKHFVRETSSERSESKETIVITKQITRRFDSSEPISGETASSIQRLRDSVHSDKMRFFDGADE